MEAKEMKNEVSLVGNESCFGRYGKAFQEKIFQALLLDRDWAAQLYEVMLPEFFEVNYLRYLTRLYFKYFNEYRSFPTMGLMITIIKDDLSQGNDIILRDQIVEYLHRMKANPHPGDIGYVKDKVLDFCRRQAFKEALHRSVELIQADKFESVMGLMKNAIAVGMPHSVGHDFFEDIEARFVKIHRNPVSTGMPRLDKPDILDGGLGRGEIGVVVAPTGVGKCTVDDTHITIRYVEIVINGKAYKPWEKVRTKRGEIFARDVKKTDELS